MSQRSHCTLLLANLGLLAMILIHDADHLRQARNWCYSIPRSVWLINLTVYAPSAIALFLTVIRRVRLAAIVTVAAGLFVAIGFLKVHLFGIDAPVWGLWARPFVELGADAISWAVLVATAAVGLFVALVGVRVLSGMSTRAVAGMMVMLTAAAGEASSPTLPNRPFQFPRTVRSSLRSSNPARARRGSPRTARVRRYWVSSRGITCLPRRIRRSKPSAARLSM